MIEFIDKLIALRAFDISTYNMLIILVATSTCTLTVITMTAVYTILEKRGDDRESGTNVERTARPVYRPRKSIPHKL